jgi:hypothetical protein
MTMNSASSGVGQGGTNTSAIGTWTGTASGSGTNNAPAAAAAPAAAPAASLPGSVPNLYPNTNPLPPVDASYVHRPVHLETVTGSRGTVRPGFHTNGQSNKVVGRMMADHLLFLGSNRLSPSKTYFSNDMLDWLKDWSFDQNPSFYGKVFQDINDGQPRIWNMPNSKSIRDQLKDLA